MGSEKEEYLKKRYTEMSVAQLELIIKQLNREQEHNPEADRSELCVAVGALQQKKRSARDYRKGRLWPPTGPERDLSEDF